MLKPIALLKMDDRDSPMLRLKPLCKALLLAGFVSGCTALGPDYQPPESEIDAGQPFIAPTAERDGSNGDLVVQQAVSPKWWESTFHDEQINQLVARAFEQNLSLRSAGLRVLQSQQQLAIATANNYPQQQTISGGASRQKAQGIVFDNYNTGFNLSWELDFWGRFQRQIESAEAQLEASIADYDSVIISLVSQVVENYILIRTYQQRIAVAKISIALQEENYQIALAKARAGDTSELDVDQAASLLNNTRASVPGLESSLQQFKNSLALLLGQSPQQFNHLLDETKTIPVTDAAVALGMPQDLIRRRPDIRAAERILAAQSAQIGFAQSELYPHLTIGGAIGNSSDSTGNLFDSQSQTWSLFGLFNWNIFNYGRLQSNVRLQDALFQQRLVDYKNTVLQAQVDVENAIVAYLKSHEQLLFYQTSADAARRAVELATFQYQNGLVGFNTVINALTAFSQQQDVLASNQGAVAANLVQVYLALGGGWELRQDRDPVELLPEDMKQQMRERTDNWGDVLQ